MRYCLFFCVHVFFFKQKKAYEMRISDWSSDVCSSDLRVGCGRKARGKSRNFTRKCGFVDRPDRRAERVLREEMLDVGEQQFLMLLLVMDAELDECASGGRQAGQHVLHHTVSSEEHTAELPSLMRTS